jgi:hypothetical protein
MQQHRAPAKRVLANGFVFVVVVVVKPSSSPFLLSSSSFSSSKEDDAGDEEEGEREESPILVLLPLGVVLKILELELLFLWFLVVLLSGDNGFDPARIVVIIIVKVVVIDDDVDDDDERKYDDAFSFVRSPSSLFFFCLSSQVSSSCQAKFQTVNLFGAFSTKKTDKTTKKEKKRANAPQKKKTAAQNFLYIRERERTRRTRRREKDFKRDEFDEIRPTNAFVGRKRSEVTLVRENSGLGRRGDERGSGEESHLGWNLATDHVRFAETDGGRERLGE